MRFRRSVRRPRSGSTPWWRRSRRRPTAIAWRAGSPTFCSQAQEVDLWQIRPLKLARDWGIEARTAIELCLQAVTNGLLELHWDLLCPRCRVPKASVVALDQLPTGAHCSSCNIDYERDFSRNVEASFRPTAAVRPIVGGQYCLFGPMSTPHIKVHVTLAAGQSRDLPADLGDGGLSPAHARAGAGATRRLGVRRLPRSDRG